jgi:hypothetical protein
MNCPIQAPSRKTNGDEAFNKIAVLFSNLINGLPIKRFKDHCKFFRVRPSFFTSCTFFSIILSERLFFLRTPYEEDTANLLESIRHCSQYGILRYIRNKRLPDKRKRTDKDIG